MKPLADGWVQVRARGVGKWEAYGLANEMRKKGLSTTKPKMHEGCYVFKVRQRRR